MRFYRQMSSISFAKTEKHLEVAECSCQKIIVVFLNPTDRYPTDLEFVCGEVTTKNDNFILASCYRQPNSNISWCRKFGETLQYLRDIYVQIVIAGDFNLPSIDWNCLENTIRSDELEFTEMLNEYVLKLLSVEPTRLNNVLDLITE